MVEVEKYILDGVDEGDIKDVSYSTNNYYLTYTLSANKNYSILFPVCTVAGTVSHTSKMITMLKDNLITLVSMHKQPPMMSRVCQWREMVMMME